MDAVKAEKDSIKVYVSIPPLGSVEEYNESRAQIAELVQRINGFDVLLMPRTCLRETLTTHLRMMRLGLWIGTMSNADLVCFSGQWQNTEECLVEHSAAKSFNLPVCYPVLYPFEDGARYTMEVRRYL